MEQSYWLGRKRASAADARSADTAESRLAHLDLAGHYSVMAAAAASRAAEGKAEEARYLRLETGARWLAGRSESEGERGEHLGHAARYRQLRLASAPGGR